MAKVELAPPITSITGSIGGLTFQTNKSGSIVRLKPLGHNSSTPKQTANQQLFNRMQKEWQSLSLNQRLLWNDYATLYPKTNIWGREKKLSGLNYFQSINRNRLLLSQIILCAPPTHTLPTAVPFYQLLVNSGALQIAFAESFRTSYDQLVVLTTPPTSNSSQLNRGLYRFTAVLNPASYLLHDITASWESAHSLSFPPGCASDSFFVNSLIYFVNPNSGLSGSGLLSQCQYNTSLVGVGYVSVGHTLVVS